MGYVLVSLIIGFLYFLLAPGENKLFSGRKFGVEFWVSLSAGGGGGIKSTLALSKNLTLPVLVLAYLGSNLRIIAITFQNASHSLE